MAYDEDLVARVRAQLATRDDVTERAMFGGLAFMVGGNMLCAVNAENLMLRLGVDAAERALEDPGVRPMDFTGRPMRGYVYVASGSVDSDGELERWLGQALDFVRTLPPKA